MKKRLIAVLLLLVMCIGILPVAALADDGDTCIVGVTAGVAMVSHRVYVNGVLTRPDVSDIVGASHYTVPKGSDVTVVFTANNGFRIVGKSTVTINNISSNTHVGVPETVRVGDGFKLSQYFAELLNLLRNSLFRIINSIFRTL